MQRCTLRKDDERPTNTVYERAGGGLVTWTRSGQNQRERERKRKRAKNRKREGERERER